MIPLYSAFLDGQLVPDLGHTDSEKCWRKVRARAKREKRSQNREALRRRGWAVRRTGWMAIR